MRDENQHIAALDGLRGVAAYIVFVSHFSGLTGFADNAFGKGAGLIGVMIFFTLSGFLMAHLHFDLTPTPGAIARFFKHRFARVIPLFVAVVLVSFALPFIFPADWKKWAFPIKTTSELMDHLFMRHGIDVLWTIPVEVQFYVLFPLVWIVASFTPKPLLAALCIGLVYVGFNFNDTLPSITGWAVSSRVGLFFVTGIAVACLTNTGPKRGRMWDGPFLAASVFTLALFPGIRSFFTGHYDGLSLGELGGAMWSEMTFAVATFLLLLTAIRSPLAYRVLGSGASAYLGKISYSLYILHMPILWYMNRFSVLPENRGVFFLVANVAVIVAATASFKLIENPCRKAINGLRLPQSISSPAPAE